MSDTKLRSSIIRLAHTNPAMRPHLLPLLTRTAAGQHPLDPRKAMVYFDLVMEEYNVEEDAGNGDELAMQIMNDDGKAANKLEGDALKKLATMFGAKISNEGHGSGGELVCKLGVDTWQDVSKINKVINSHQTGGDDTIDVGVQYFAAQGFVLFPQGVNGPRYGNTAGSKGDLDEWLDEHK